MKSLRKEKGLTQKQVYTAIKVSRTIYIGWESQRDESALPHELHKVIALCELLETDLIYLCTGMFDGQKQIEHQDDYINIFSRYKSDPNFYLLLNYLMGWDDRVIKHMTNWVESMDDQYLGPPSIRLDD